MYYDVQGLDTLLMLLHEILHNKGEQVALSMYEVEVEADLDVNVVEPLKYRQRESQVAFLAVLEQLGMLAFFVVIREMQRGPGVDCLSP
jgi:hypothetical protein